MEKLTKLLGRLFQTGITRLAKKVITAVTTSLFDKQFITMEIFVAQCQENKTTGLFYVFAVPPTAEINMTDLRIHGWLAIWNRLSYYGISLAWI